MFLLKFKPYNNRILQASNVATEMCIGVLMLGFSIYLFNVSESLKGQFESSMIYLVMLILAIQTFASLAGFALSIYQLIRTKGKGLRKVANCPNTKESGKIVLNNTQRVEMTLVETQME